MSGERAQIKEFILMALAPQVRPDDLRDDLPLFKARIVDSMSVVRLVCFLEDRFGIKVRAHEIGLDNFDTLEALERFVERKRRPSS